MDIDQTSIAVLPREEVEKIKWEDYYQEYDLQLFLLGKSMGLTEFIVINPILPTEFALSKIDTTAEAAFGVIWTFNSDWIAKKFTANWQPATAWHYISVVLEFKTSWELNPIFDGINFIDSPVNKFQIPLYDTVYEHIWYLTEELGKGNKIWVAKCKTSWGNQGTKEIGYLTPIIKTEAIEKNNPAIAHLQFDIEYTVSEYEWLFEHVWYLDPRYSNGEKIWVKKISYVPNPIGTIDRGYALAIVDLRERHNDALDFVDFEPADDSIPYSELIYNNVWYLDPKYSNDDKVWVKAVTGVAKPQGIKDKGFLTPLISNQPDVVFISYKELDADKNWLRVKEKFSKAKRVHGVVGILEAHKKAATVAGTDMVYIVDGDAYLEDSWTFDFNPKIFDRNFVHVFRSRNPINDLLYGYGGVKLFPRKLLLAVNEWNVDMTTSIGARLKLMTKISNTTAFNTDEFSTWRSAFRECAKLSSRIIDNQVDDETEARLNTWCTVGIDKPFGRECIHGARAGRDYGEKYKNDAEKLKMINNFSWLENEYKQYIRGGSLDV